MIQEPKLKEEVKVKEEVRKAFMEEGRHLKFVYRDMALSEPTASDAWYARDIEAYVDILINQEGWTIKETHVIGRREAAAHLGDAREQVLGMLIVLVK